MHSLLRTRTILVLGAVVFLASATWADETSVIRALTRLKTSVQSNVSIELYRGLLSDAKAEIDITKKERRTNEAFVIAANSCWWSYNLARVAWEVRDRMERIGSRDAKEWDSRMRENWSSGGECVEMLYSLRSKKSEQPRK